MLHAASAHAIAHDIPLPVMQGAYADFPEWLDEMEKKGAQNRNVPPTVCDWMITRMGADPEQWVHTRPAKYRERECVSWLLQ